MSYCNQATIRLQPMLLRIIWTAKASPSCPRTPKLFYARSVLAPVAPTEMRFGSTPTFVRGSPGITPSTNVVHTSLGNALYGLRIAIPSSSYCPTKAATLRCCACRCALCVETLTSCIAPAQNWLNPIIGPSWALISN
jgi:hypothetical protein